MTRSSYFRRCHICAHLSHIDDSHHIEHCQKCGKSLARFMFFDDRLTRAESDRSLRTPPLGGEYKPLLGLTVFWDGP